ncbi:MAG: DUF5063 domain-containing protein [Bacteroidales bacterium]|nr:DUF5063 domain-containing protein [Bacteroidales bacterium]
MDKASDPLYSGTVVEFVAAANEFCRYAERAGELKGDELLKIMQRILPYMYIKASLLPSLEPFFEDGNEKFVTEADWNRIKRNMRMKFGNADDYLEVFDERAADSGAPVLNSVSENLTDIYQDIKDFLLLYQTGTTEVMNDAVWECKMNFENIWGQKLVNAMRAIHMFLYSGEELREGSIAEGEEDGDPADRDVSGWFISKRQKDLREDAE